MLFFHVGLLRCSFVINLGAHPHLLVRASWRSAGTGQLADAALLFRSAIFWQAAAEPMFMFMFHITAVLLLAALRVSFSVEVCAQQGTCCANSSRAMQLSTQGPAHA